MRATLVVLFATVACLAAHMASAEDLQGDACATAMNGNTLTGKNAQGVEFHAFFISGGEVTYEDADGKRGAGTWSLDEAGDVCVTWLQPTKEDLGCFKVHLNGAEVTWEGKTGTHHGGLRGEVAPLNVSKP